MKVNRSRKSDKGGRLMKIYVYGMRLRGFSPGAQPKDGLICGFDPSSRFNRYWSVLYYNRELTAEECSHYSLDLLYVKE